MNLHVVSFYTPDDRYRQYAARLLASCQKFSLPATIVEIGEATVKELDWVEITLLKPRFILQCMRELARPLLWVDADGYFEAAPRALLEPDADFAIYAHERGRRTWKPVGRDTEQLPEDWPDTRWFLTGTVYLRNTKPGMDLLEAWCRLAVEQPRGYEQLLCQYAWCETRPNTLWLPEVYCSIYGRAQPAVICHDLASSEASRGGKRVVRA